MGKCGSKQEIDIQSILKHVLDSEILRQVLPLPALQSVVLPYFSSLHTYLFFFLLLVPIRTCVIKIDLDLLCLLATVFLS